MKKLLTLCFMVAIFSNLSFAAIPFNKAFPMSFKTGLPEGWTAGGTTEVVDGGTKVTCALIGEKYRADLKYNMTNTSDALYVEVDATAYKVFAMQCIGSCAESGNIKGNLNILDNDWTTKMNIGWTEKPTGSLVDADGNYTYYWIIGADKEAWTGTKTIQKIELKIADITQEADKTYIVSDINWFKNLEDLENSLLLKEETAVVNQTTKKGYADLTSAWNEATDNDIMIVNENQTVTKRLTNGARNLTVKGKSGDVRITIAPNIIPFISNNRNYNLTFENITIDGDNKSSSSELIQGGTGNAWITFNNVNIINAVYTGNKGLVVAKGGSKVALNGISFENCTTPENIADVFIGGAGSTISGNNSLSIGIEVKNINYALTVDKPLENTVPIRIIPYASTEYSDFPENYIFVKGTNDTSKFTLADTSKMSLDTDGNNLVAKTNTTVGVEEITTVATDETVEFYNLQGIKVANPENGIFIRVQGKDVKKVHIK